jgi:hypothetical protein
MNQDVDAGRLERRVRLEEIDFLVLPTDTEQYICARCKFVYCRRGMTDCDLVKTGLDVPKPQQFQKKPWAF